MEIIFYSHANKTPFHKKGCAPSLILKVMVFGTRKWPIERDGISAIKFETLRLHFCDVFVAIAVVVA